MVSVESFNPYGLQAQFTDGLTVSTLLDHKKSTMPSLILLLHRLENQIKILETLTDHLVCLSLRFAATPTPNEPFVPRVHVISKQDRFLGVSEKFEFL